MDRQLIHRDSLFSIRKELDYGQVPPTDASVCLYMFVYIKNAGNTIGVHGTASDDSARANK